MEARQRTAGLSVVLTAAEIRQLGLLCQITAHRLADSMGQGEQALVFHRVAEKASRQLCELQPGRAAYLLHLAASIAQLEAGSAAPQVLDAYRAALQAATAEKGACV